MPNECQGHARFSKGTSECFETLYANKKGHPQVPFYGTARNYGQADGVVTSNVAGCAFPAPTTIVAVVLAGGVRIGPTVPGLPRVTVIVFPVAAAVSAVAGLTDVVTAVESVGAVVAVVVTDATTCAC